MSVNRLVEERSIISNSRGRMLLTDIEAAKKIEYERRKKLRLQQVRQQSKELACTMREKVRNEEQALSKMLEQKRHLELKEWKERRAKCLQQQYQEVIKNIGLGHREAAEQPDVETIKEKERARNEAESQRRWLMATEKQRQEVKEKMDKETARLEKLQFAKTIENLRAACITSLPLPPSHESVPPEKVRSSNLKKKSSILQEVQSNIQVRKEETGETVKQQPVKVCHANKCRKIGCVQTQPRSRSQLRRTSAWTKKKQLNRCKSARRQRHASESACGAASDDGFHSDSTWPPRSPRVVKLYDHASQLTMDYSRPETCVTRLEMQQGELEEMKAVLDEVRMEEGARVTEQTTASRASLRRGWNAMSKERLRKDFRHLKQQLAELTREERLARSRTLTMQPPDMFFGEACLKAHLENRQKRMDSAFESVFQPASVLTLPRRSISGPELNVRAWKEGIVKAKTVQVVQPSEQITAPDTPAAKLNVAQCTAPAPLKASSAGIQVTKSEETLGATVAEQLDKHMLPSRKAQSLVDLLQRAHHQKQRLLEEVQTELQRPEVGEVPTVKQNVCKVGSDGPIDMSFKEAQTSFIPEVARDHLSEDRQPCPTMQPAVNSKDKRIPSPIPHVAPSHWHSSPPPSKSKTESRKHRSHRKSHKSGCVQTCGADAASHVDLLPTDKESIETKLVQKKSKAKQHGSPRRSSSESSSGTTLSLDMSLSKVSIEQTDSNQEMTSSTFEGVQVIVRLNEQASELKVDQKSEKTKKHKGSCKKSSEVIVKGVDKKNVKLSIQPKGPTWNETLENIIADNGIKGNGESSGTSYFSPPEYIDPQKSKLIQLLLSQGRKDNKTVVDIKEYVKKLLAMSRETVAELGVSASDISTTSDIVTRVETVYPPSTTPAPCPTPVTKARKAVKKRVVMRLPDPELDKVETGFFPIGTCYEPRRAQRNILAGNQSDSVTIDTSQFTSLAEMYSKRISNLAKMVDSVGIDHLIQRRGGTLDSSSYMSIPSEINDSVWLNDSIRCAVSSGPYHQISPTFCEDSQNGFINHIGSCSSCEVADIPNNVTLEGSQTHSENDCTSARDCEFRTRCHDIRLNLLPIPASQLDGTKQIRDTPPPYLSTGKFKLNGSLHQQPHELSTIIEVETPGSSRYNSTHQMHPPLQSTQPDEIVGIIDVSNNADISLQTLPSYWSDTSTVQSDNSNAQSLNSTIPDFMNELLRRNIISTPYSWVKEVESAEGKEDISNETTGGSGTIGYEAGSEDDRTQGLTKRMIKSDTFKSATEMAVQVNKDKKHVLISSSPDDLDNAFQNFGLSWAGTTLRKTREADELSAGSSSQSNGKGRTRTEFSGKPRAKKCQSTPLVTIFDKSSNELSNKNTMLLPGDESKLLSSVKHLKDSNNHSFDLSPPAVFLATGHLVQRHGRSKTDIHQGHRGKYKPSSSSNTRHSS